MYLLTLKNGNGKETVAEAAGVREREAHELVHFRTAPNQRCQNCNVIGGVWMDKKSAWSQHTMRCE